MASYRVVVVGSGFSGLAIGHMLKQRGIHDFVILEKGASVGGTWRDNTYPGAACDVPSHLYSFSFAPRTDWPRSFSPQHEIRRYLENCAQRFGLDAHLRFGCEVEGAEFHEGTGTWTVTLAGGESLEAGALVLGNGALHVPSMPKIDGLESFHGPVFHSARWDHSFDPSGKRVGTIGTGASAIQFVPHLAKSVARLDLFQRSAPWVVPKADYAIPPSRQSLYARIPLLRRMVRARTWLAGEFFGLLMLTHPTLMRPFEWLARRDLARKVADPVLRAKLTPRFTMGCKRILLSNDWYEALQRPNVDVVTSGIRRVTEHGIVTDDGVEHRLDAIVCGTGFVVGDYLTNLRIVGRGGRTLAESQQQKRGNWLGIQVSGFPNLFFLMGPNTGLGHNSMIFMIEAQARYVSRAIDAIGKRGLRWIDVREQVQRRFSDRLQAKLRRSVWATGCTSWYVGNDGHNSVTWPWLTVRYWWMARTSALAVCDTAPTRSASRDRSEGRAYGLEPVEQ